MLHFFEGNEKVWVYLKNKYENILRAHILFSGWNIPIYFPIGFMLQLFEMSLW